MDTLRLTLLISLSILFVAMLWKRFKQRTMAKDLPAPSHAELLSLHVLYHPERLRVKVKVPSDQELVPAVLDGEHVQVFVWPSVRTVKGSHVLELPLNSLADGDHYFEMGTDTQRTVRRFSLTRA
jgi:hypothetical protein